METLTELLQRAQQRAHDSHLPYAGALTPREAQQVLQLAPGARLVDVRSRPELDLVGRVPGAIHLEWAFYPQWDANPDFLAQLRMQVDTQSVALFLCRSGARSDKAARAAREAGYAHSYNVLEGFEGAADAATKQRGAINGWRVANLPWTNA